MLWLSIVIDNACTRIWDAWGTGQPVTSLRVSPAVYDLGLPLIADPGVATYEPVVHGGGSAC